MCSRSSDRRLTPSRKIWVSSKLDYEPTDEDRFELTGFIRQENQVSGASGQTATSAEAQYKNNSLRWNLQWQHSADNWVNLARVSHQNSHSGTDSTNVSPQQQYFYFENAPAASPNATAIVVGGPGDGVGFRNGQSGTEFDDDFTLPNLQWLGDHTVKFGGRFADINLVAQNASSNLSTATYYWGVTSAGV